MTTFAAWPQGYLVAAENKLMDYGTVAPATWSDSIANTGPAATNVLTTLNGVPVLKVTLPVGNTSWGCGVSSGLSLGASWDGEIGVLCYFPEAAQNTEIRIQIANSGFTEYASKAWAGSLHTDAGWRWLWQRQTAAGVPGQPDVVGTINASTVARGKIRIIRTDSSKEEVVYVAYMGFAPRTRPVIMLSVDDGIDSAYDWLMPELVARELPCDYGLHSDLLNQGGCMTSRDVDALVNHSSGLFGVYSHTTSNNSVAALGVSEYVARFLQCADVLRGLGAPDPTFYHPYVQGVTAVGLSQQLRALGCKVARTAGGSRGDYLKYIHPTTLLNGTGLETMELPTILNLNSSLTLADAKTEVDDLIRLRRTGAIYGHGFVTASPNAQTWLQSDMTSLLNYIALKRDLGLVDVVSVKDWYRGLTQPALVV